MDERDSHVGKLSITFHWLLPIPQYFHSRIKELNCVYLYLCDLDRCNPLFLVL
jgi:hypothetical protein